jgi:hypothetical protein
MKIAAVLLAGAIAFGVGGCGGTTSQQAQTSDNNTMRPDNGDHRAVAHGNGPAAKADGTRLEGDAPPADAQFTIFCDAIRGPNHVLAATAIKDRLMQEKGLRNWHILHSADQSAIFYGYYKTFDDRVGDPQEVARAQSDMKLINALTNVQKDKLFKSPLFLPINNPDPDAPPQWNLVNTPQTAFWSLQIAAYQGSPERKKYAVDVVREFRNRGIEAYYFHGETISSVCIGAWPQEAVKRQERPDAGTAADDPDRPIIVTNQQLPPNVSPDLMDKEGHHLQIEAPKLEVLDPTMAKAIRDYPAHAVNGENRERTAANGQKILDPSFLVLIPHSDAPPAPLMTLPPVNITASNGAERATSDILDDVHPTPAPRGQLRGIDNH